MRIKKTSETTPTQAQVINQQSQSTSNSYSANYTNNNFMEKYSVSTDSVAVKTGRIVDGKEEYVVRVDGGNMPNNTSKGISLPFSLANVTITRPVFLFGQSSNNEYPIMQEGIKWFIATETSQTSTITVTTTSDRSRFTCKIEIYYTNNN